MAATHCDKVELFLNGKSFGSQNKTYDFIDPYRGTERVQGSELLVGVNTGYIYAFPNITFSPGTLKAVASFGGKIVAQQELQTAGEPKAIRLTLHTGTKGLQADGSDVALIDFEVVALIDFEVIDVQGRRCPTDEARVDFKVSGPVIWRGGFNAADLNSTNNLYLNTECGINRVAIRSTLTPGMITVTATRKGLKEATVKVESIPVEIAAGLTLEMPQKLPGFKK